MIVPFVFAALAALLLTPAAGWAGRRWGILDLPDARKTHRGAIPRTGGWAVFAAVTGAFCLGGAPSMETLGLWAGGAVIFLLGAVDDARGLPAASRLAGQVAASLIVVGAGLRVTFVPHGPGETLMEGAITVVWLVGVTNAFNFLDGVDGLAGAMGALCACLFGALLLPTEQLPAARGAAALAGACLGFLPYNWRPARIFLGDGGSTLIGFTLAGLAVMGSWASDQPVVALSTPLLVLAIPIYDMIYTTVSRIKNGSVRSVKQWIEHVGRDHFHHRCMTLGLTEGRTVGFILLVNLCLGVAALTLRGAASAGDAGLLLFQALLIFIIITVLMVLGRQVS